MCLFSVLCKPVLILYTWPSGTEAQLWLIETTNKERSLSPRSLRNRRWERHGTEIAKGQGGWPVVRAHLSHSLYTCMLTRTHTLMHHSQVYKLSQGRAVTVLTCSNSWEEQVEEIAGTGRNLPPFRQMGTFQTTWGRAQKYTWVELKNKTVSVHPAKLTFGRHEPFFTKHRNEVLHTGTSS